MEFTPHRLKNGQVLLVRKVSMWLAQEVQKHFPPPPPPVQRANYGTEEEPDWRDEPNPAHPDHGAALERHDMESEVRMAALAIVRGVRVEWNEEKEKALAEVRDDMKLFGIDLDEQVRAIVPLAGEKLNLYVYVRYIVCSDPASYEELVSTLIGMSQPTEAAIAENVEMFQAEVQGA